MYRSILWLVWLVLPVFVLAYHYGPGQSWLARDHAADLIAKAESQSSAAMKAQTIAYETQFPLMEARRTAFAAGMDWQAQPEHPLAKAVAAGVADQAAAYDKAAEIWGQAADSCELAIQSLLNATDKVNGAQRELSATDRRLLESLRWAEARAMVRSGEVFNGIEQLQALLDLRMTTAGAQRLSNVRLSASLTGEESSTEAMAPKTVALGKANGLPTDAIREELAAAQYIGARLLREEGRPQEVWRPVANSARQHYRYLSDTGNNVKDVDSLVMKDDSADASIPSARKPTSAGSTQLLDRDQRLQRNLEQVLNLEQVKAEELEGLPLPISAPLARRPGDSGPGENPGKPGVGELQEGPPGDGAGLPGPSGLGW